MKSEIEQKAWEAALDLMKDPKEFFPEKDSRRGLVVKYGEGVMHDVFEAIPVGVYFKPADVVSHLHGIRYLKTKTIRDITSAVLLAYAGSGHPDIRKVGFGVYKLV